VDWRVCAVLDMCSHAIAVLKSNTPAIVTTAPQIVHISTTALFFVDLLHCAAAKWTVN